jgi:hypothetical protein
VDESTYYVAIALAFFGFVAIAFILLFPVYRFLKREEKQSEQWTASALAERQRQAIRRKERTPTAGDGVATEPPPGPGAPGEPPELRI